MSQKSSTSHLLAPTSQNNANLSKKRSVVLHKDASPLKRGDEEYSSFERIQQSRVVINADIESLRE